MPRSPKTQVEKRTRHELRQLQELMNHLPVVVYRYRLEDGQRPHLLYISEGVQRLTGQSAAEVMADPMLLFARIHPDDWPGFAAADLQAWQTQSDFALELRFILPSGDACWLYFSSLPFELADGSIAYHGFIEDITQRKRDALRAQESESLQQQIFDTSSVAIFLVDRQGIITRANESMARMFQRPCAQIVGSPYVSLVHPDERDLAHQKMLALLGSDINEVDLERLYWRSDASMFWGNLSGKRFHDSQGQDRGLLGVIMDITVRRQAQEEIRSLAFYDPLTNLPNRRLLLDRIEHAMAGCARNGTHGAVLFIDLDNFKTLNDTLGHDTGDALLVQVAQRLRENMRQEDTVARLGGDEFIVLLAGLHGSPAQAANEAETVGQHIIQTLSAPYQLGTHAARSTPSLGIALFHGGRTRVDELLKQADLAMYEAKAAGRNTLRFFDPRMQAAINARAAMEKALYRALDNAEFELHYQPQVNAQGRCIGVEALLRWSSPELGMVSPAVFIPVAEETGQILAIGRWVLQQACRQQVLWQQDASTCELEIAINVSARQFRAPDFAPALAQIMAATGANPARLQLELTESMLLQDADECIARMHTLGSLGVRFALDDFGTGYSSLAYLKRLPLSQLKIDQSFVRDILGDANDRAICQAVIALAHSMGLRVIAEGVETREHWQMLQAQGCDEGQGYFFARPLSVDALQQWLDTRQEPSLDLMRDG